MAKKVGNNVVYEVKNNKLIVEVDLTQNFGESKSGKSVQIGSTQGNKEVAEGIFMGLNVYKKA
jgi:hypothetical protein